MPYNSLNKEKIRALSGIETYMANSHLTQRGTSQITTLLHIRGFIDPIILKEAYHQLCKDEPLLTASIEKENNIWLLIKRNTQNITSHKDFFSYETSPSPLIASDQLLEEEMHKILDPQCQLTRLRLISSEEKDEHLLCFTQHHGVSDAFTAKRLLSQLLHKIAEKTTAPPLQKIHHKKHAYPVFSSQNSQQEAQVVAPFSPLYQNLSDALHSFTSQKDPIKDTIARTSLCTLIFDESFLTPLDALAKKHHISLNSLLSTLLGHSVRELLQLSHLPTLTAVSNRLHHDQTGCFIDVAPIGIEEVDLLKSARIFHDKMQEFKNYLFQKPSCFPLTAHSEIMILSQEKAISLCQGVGFTNSGRIEKIPCPDSLEILAYRSVTKRDWGDMFPVFHFSFFNQKLIISIASPTLFLDKKQETCLANHIYKNFLSLIPSSLRNH